MCFSQNDYADYPYPHVRNPKATIQSDDSIPTAMAMVLTELGVKTNPVAIAKLALDSGSRLEKGTDIFRLCNIIGKMHEEIVITTTSDSTLMKAALLRGAKVIACLSDRKRGGEGDCGQLGYPHTVAVVEVDGDIVIVWDPDFSTEKPSPDGEIRYEPGNLDLRVNLATLHRETEGFSPRYFVFDGPQSIDNLPL